MLIALHAQTRDHQIINDAAFSIEKLRVALLPSFETLNIGGHKFFERFGSGLKIFIIRNKEDLPHMGDIKQPRFFARMPDLKTTALHAIHKNLGAKMVPFAGYDMPVQYPLGVLKEHLA